MKKNKKLAKVYHYDLYGKRDEKYKFLEENSINSVEWNELDIREPDFYFIDKDYLLYDIYTKGIFVKNLFSDYSSGIQTEFDNFSIQMNKSDSIELINDLKNLELNEILIKYKLDSKFSKKVEKAINDIKNFKSIITPILYRPFDMKSSIYTGNSNGIMGRPRNGIMKHFLKRNIGLALTKLNRGISSGYYFPINTISERHLLDTAGDSIGIFPLYLYPEAGEQATLDHSGEATTPSFGYPSTGEELGRQPNLDMKLVGVIAKGLGLEFRDVAPWDEDGLSLRGLGAKRRGRGNLINEAKNSARFPRSARNDVYFTPIDLLDYIYAVLHSPTYREKYKEFLKIDFPRVPFPKDKEKFWQLVDLGSQIRQLHLLETADKYMTSYPIDGTNIITRKMTKNSMGYEHTGNGVGRVWINDEQYFDGVPEVAWEFYIGGYQPAQKWLKDRVSTPLNNPRPLTYEDINHYQKIIVALTETDRLMKEVDRVGVE